VHELPTEFDEAVTIVPQSLCDAALTQARSDFQARYPDPTRVCVMPILRGGRIFGDALGYPANPIRMSYYRGGERLPEPICLQKPDPALMVDAQGRTLPIVLLGQRSPAALRGRLAGDEGEFPGGRPVHARRLRPEGGLTAPGSDTPGTRNGPGARRVAP